MRILSTGDYIYWKDRNEFVEFIIYWKERNVIVFAYQLFSMKRYEEIYISNFEKKFLIEKEEIKEYIDNMIKKEKNKEIVKVPQKELKKLELQKTQLRCMEKLNKPDSDKNKGIRNIKRQLRKINHYIERNEEKNKEIDIKYSSILENFENIFGE